MSLPKTGRYIKRNLIDHLIAVLLILLAFSLVARGGSLLLAARTDRTCRAEVSFVVRGVEADTVAALLDSDAPFRFTDNGGVFGEGLRRTEIRPTTVVVEQEDGSFVEQSSPSLTDVFFSFSAEGARAKDGGFLLRGVRRLASGDRLSLSRGDARYTAELLRVQIS